LRGQGVNLQFWKSGDDGGGQTASEGGQGETGQQSLQSGEVSPEESGDTSGNASPEIGESAQFNGNDNKTFQGEDNTKSNLDDPQIQPRQYGLRGTQSAGKDITLRGDKELFVQELAAASIAYTKDGETIVVSVTEENAEALREILLGYENSDSIAGGETLNIAFE
jgi:hypothetical protein